MVEAKNPRAFARRLLAWYDRDKRDLPWRSKPGHPVTAYETLVSELMLQQTVVATVVPYFHKFRARFPDFAALARAAEEDVMHAWAGLGYYARPRNLHRAARAVMAEYGGRLPGHEEALRSLPGVGEYTAAAVAAIAFGQPVFALDGNAARVMARVGNERASIADPQTRRRLRAFGQALVPADRPGDFAQAVMELGATVCGPRRPDCAACPIAGLCAARAAGTQAQVPVKPERAAKKNLHLLCVAAEREGRFVLGRRAAGTLLGGTWMLPFVQWTGAGAAVAGPVITSALRGTGLHLEGARKIATPVRHVFTHLDVSATVVRGGARGRLRAGEGGWEFCVPDERAQSSFVRKLLRAAATL